MSSASAASEKLALAQERRVDDYLERFFERRLSELFSEADTVGPDKRKKLMPILKHYAREAHPFRACVRDNTKRFGKDRVNKVCAVVKDIIRGSTKWRGHPELDKGSTVGYAIDEELATLLEEHAEAIQLAVTDAREAVHS